MRNTRPRLTPAIADVRRAVRGALADFGATPTPAPVENSGMSALNAAYRPAGGALLTETPEFSTGRLVLVALSGGPDSLALAAATAFEAPRAGLRVGAVIVDHGLQEGSTDVAAAAAHQARELGLDPVIVVGVEVGTDGGPEAAARDARYGALVGALRETGAAAILLGHTLDDQAETVLLGLARGSGAGSLHGMAHVAQAPVAIAPSATASATASATVPATASAEIRHTGVPKRSEAPFAGIRTGGGVILRPLLGIRRAKTVQFCADSGLTPWADPHNFDPAFTRVRVREIVLPLLEAELGPGIAEALARTADQLREDESALDHFAEELVADLAEHAEAGIALAVRGLATNPPALRQRIIRLAVSAEFDVALSRSQTLEVARLVTDWHGQGPLHLPGIRVERRHGLLVFSAAAIGEN